MILYVGLELGSLVSPVYSVGSHEEPIDFIHEDDRTACFFDTESNKIFKIPHEGVDIFIKANKIFSVCRESYQTSDLFLKEIPKPLLKGFAYPSGLAFRLRDNKHSLHILRAVTTSDNCSVECNNRHTYAFYKGVPSTIYTESFKGTIESICCSGDALLLAGRVTSTARFSVGYQEGYDGKYIYGVYKINKNIYSDALESNSQHIESFIDVVDMSFDFNEAVSIYDRLNDGLTIEHTDAVNKWRKRVITENLFKE